MYNCYSNLKILNNFLQVCLEHYKKFINKNLEYLILDELNMNFLNVITQDKKIKKILTY